VEVIRCHHERWDGKGYPAGLSGDAIPAGARVFSVADAFDAMTSDRPYREAIPFGQACQEIADGAGSQFDPAVVDASPRSSPTSLASTPPSTTVPCAAGLWAAGLWAAGLWAAGLWTALPAPFRSPLRSPTGGPSPDAGR
jgi:hypothetical protein